VNLLVDTHTIETKHLPAMATLPFHHRDPFDRLIICQAMAEKMPICTSDSNFAAYGIQQVW
jgi:PIN domain nuclease of toxin-antitoxin system